MLYTLTAGPDPSVNTGFPVEGDWSFQRWRLGTEVKELVLVDNTVFYKRVKCRPHVRHVVNVDRRQRSHVLAKPTAERRSSRRLDDLH